MPVKPLLLLSAIILSCDANNQARSADKRQAELGSEELLGLKSFIKQLFPSQLESEDQLKQVTTQELSRLFPQNKLSQIDPIQDSLKSEHFILQAGRPQIFLIEDAGNFAEEDRDSGRRGDSPRRNGAVLDLEDFNEEINEISTDSPVSEFNEEVTEKQETEFSTIKLDLTSKAFVLDRRSGIRKLQNENSFSSTPSSVKADATTTTTATYDEEESFGEVLEINLTVEAPTSGISEDYDEANIDIPDDEKEEVDRIINTEIFKKETKTSIERSSITDIGSRTTRSTTITIITTGSTTRSTTSSPTRSTTGSTTRSTTKSTSRSTTSSNTRSTTSSTTRSTISSTTRSTRSSTTITTITTTVTSTTSISSSKRRATRPTPRSRFQFRKPPRRNKNIGFNRGAVEAKPRLIDINSSRRNSSRRKTSVLMNESISKPSESLKAAIPLISYWIVDHIKSDPSLSCSDIPSVISRLVDDNGDMLESDDFDEDLMNSAEKIATLLVNLINKQEQADNRIDTENKDVKDSVHGDDVRRRNRERIRNQNFNKFSSQRNVCGCEHGGECLEASKTCFCSHGFTGERCQKRVRKALMVGGLTGLLIRNDTELVGGLEVRRCSPPDFPVRVISATGQTLGPHAVVCGGAAHQDSGALVSSEQCYVWRQSQFQSPSAWSQELSLQTPRSWSSSVVRPGSDGGLEMLVVGGVGSDNSSLASLEVISLSPRPQSTLLPLSLPSGLAAHCTVQLNSSHTLIVGGATSFSLSNITSATWYLTRLNISPASSMSQARAGHSCTSLVSPVGEVEVLVAGGVTMAGPSSVRTVLDTVEIFNPRTGRWRHGPRLPRPLFGGSMLELSGQPVLFGGRYQDETGLHQTSQSYLYQNIWRSGALRLRQPRDLATILPAPPSC